MARQITNCFGFLAGTGLVTCCSVMCYSQHTNPTIEEVLQVWKNRQEKVVTARFDMSCEDTTHKGSTSILTANRQRVAGLPPETEPNPPHDMMAANKRELKLSGQKLRYRYDNQQWDPRAKKLYSEHYLDVFNGHLCKSLRDPSTGQDHFPSGIVRRADAPRSKLRFPVVPLIWTFRGNDPKFFGKLGEFQLTGKTATLTERPCLELVHESGSNNREVLYIDIERDYVVVKEMILVADKPNWQLDISYVSDATVGWVPHSWEYIIRFGGESHTLQSGRVAVVDYALNPQINNDEFDIQFPPGTRIHDDSSGVEVQYVIQENGEKGREIPSMASPSYEDLNQPSNRINRWVLTLLWSGVFALCLAMWILLRLRRRGRISQQT